jgi:cobalamin biosynthesis Mg chelatase CobN
MSWFRHTPVIDPTKNVLEYVQAAITRQDDLRAAESRHVREVATLRERYAQQLRAAESDRIDAIRAVDVAAVNRAGEVAVAQATTLAAQVAISAVSATAALTAALEPVQKDIADLRRSQYEQQGQKTQQTETSTRQTGSIGLWIGIAAVIVTLIIGIGTAVVLVVSTNSSASAPLVECVSAGKVIACP